VASVGMAATAVLEGDGGLGREGRVGRGLQRMRLMQFVINRRSTSGLSVTHVCRMVSVQLIASLACLAGSKHKSHIYIRASCYEFVSNTDVYELVWIHDKA